MNRHNHFSYYYSHIILVILFLAVAFLEPINIHDNFLTERLSCHQSKSLLSEMDRADTNSLFTILNEANGADDDLVFSTSSYQQKSPINIVEKSSLTNYTLCRSYYGLIANCPEIIRSSQHLTDIPPPSTTIL